MPLLTRKRVLLAKKETTYGVDPTPLGANAVLINGLTVTPLEADSVDRDLVRPYLGRSEQLMVGLRTMVEFNVEIQGSGTAGTAPAYNDLLLACGFSATTAAGASVTYAPVSNLFDSVGLYFNVDGVLHKMLGSRGSVSFGFTTKQIPYMKFKFMGLFSPVTDAAQVVPVFGGYKTPLPVSNLNTTPFTLHAVSPLMSALEIDMNVSMVHRTLVGGAENVLITDRQPQGSVTIEANTMAVKNWFATAANNTLGALAITHGTVAGSKFAVSIPNLQLTKPVYQDMDGVAMLQMGLNLVPGSAGNDEISIVVS